MGHYKIIIINNYNVLLYICRVLFYHYIMIAEKSQKLMEKHNIIEKSGIIPGMEFFVFFWKLGYSLGGLNGGDHSLLGLGVGV